MMKAIILAGGFGTRLKDVVSNVPKPMAPVAGRPFLEYILLQLKAQGVKETVICVGYKKECIIDFFKFEYNGISIEYAVEEEPLYTGGAVRNAMEQYGIDSAFVINGDTLFNVDFHRLGEKHKESGAVITVAAKHMENFSRYGAIECDEDEKVLAFKEKQPVEKGYINGGIYVVEKSCFDGIAEKGFSFEERVLQPLSGEGKVYICPSEGYFIDIGIPEDYARANAEFSKL